MKRYILLLAIVISSCSTHPTAPATPQNYPFPSTLRQITVSFNELTEQWEETGDEWYKSGPGSETHSAIDESGVKKASRNFTFNLADSSFTHSGDTIRGPGIMIVVNQALGTIDSLYFTSVAGWNSYLHMDILRVPYHFDTANTVQVALSGGQLKSGVLLSLDSTFDVFGEWAGASGNVHEVFTGDTISNSLLTIHFVP